MFGCVPWASTDVPNVDEQEGVLKVRSTIRKEDTELRHSELIAWLKSEIRDRDRADGRTHDKVRLLRQSSHQETTAAVSTDHEPDVRILTSLHRGKKVNRRTVIEEGISSAQLKYASNR